MRLYAVLAAMAAVCVLVVGCIETKQDYTLNPDGSGKVVVEVIKDDTMAMMMGAPQEQQDPEMEARRFVKQVMDGTQGVDAWENVSHDKTPDGRTRFRGTAYFADLAKLKLQAAGASNIEWVKEGDGMVLRVREDEAKPEAAPAEPAPELTDEQLKMERLKYQQMRVMMDATIGRMKIDVSYMLPGTLAEVSVFKKDPSGAVRMTVEGGRILAAMDEMMQDDANVRKMAGSGGRNMGMKMDENMKEKVLGGKGPITARVKGDLKPLFDYAAQSKAAREAMPAMIERLGLDKLPAAPAPTLMPPGFGQPGGGGPAAK
jgi:hypothetical protein